jgi:hypothetical protein
MPSCDCVWPCLHPPCVYSRAHHRAHCSAHGHMQRRASMCALADVYIRNVAYAHSTSLTRSRVDALECTCAHTHAHSQTDGITHTGGISLEQNTLRHTYAHTCPHTGAYIKTYTHEHSQKHKRTCARTCIFTSFIHAKTCTHLITNSCLHTHIHTRTHILSHIRLHT